MSRTLIIFVVGFALAAAAGFIVGFFSRGSNIDTNTFIDADSCGITKDLCIDTYGLLTSEQYQKCPNEVLDGDDVKCSQYTPKIDELDVKRLEVIGKEKEKLAGGDVSVKRWIYFGLD